MTIKIVRNDVDKVTDRLVEIGTIGIPKIGHDAEATMKNEVHVVTGNLKNNTGFTETGPGKGELHASTPYARLHNDGTYKTPPNPYWTHGYEGAKRDLKDLVQAAKKEIS
jgi:hypothetical protein